MHFLSRDLTFTVLKLCVLTLTTLDHHYQLTALGFNVTWPTVLMKAAMYACCSVSMVLAYTQL